MKKKLIKVVKWIVRLPFIAGAAIIFVIAYPIIKLFEWAETE